MNSMRYPRILEAIRSAKWAVTPGTLHAIRDTLSARLTGRIAEYPGNGGGDDEDGAGECPPFEMVAAGVAEVQMRGIIGRNLSALEMACGGCDLAVVESNLMAALAAPGVGAVVLNIDSPGGVVGGVAEFAARIGELSAESGKPIWAYASGQCCSAAYWIACGCAGISAAPSADVGSIGVYMALIDESANWAKEGYELVLIKAGEFKAAGIAGSKITDEQRALWQADVDDIYGQFSAAVRDGRGGRVANSAMQGQVFFGQRAIAAGLIDRIDNSAEHAAQNMAPLGAR